LQTTGFASEVDTCTKSNEAELAVLRASLNDRIPIFSPLAPISITSSALIFSLIGVIFFFDKAMRVPTYYKNIKCKTLTV
jgi:hypothetical protein